MQMVDLNGMNYLCLNVCVKTKQYNQKFFFFLFFEACIDFEISNYSCPSRNCFCSSTHLDKLNV